jgi:hypothetical protein
MADAVAGVAVSPAASELSVAVTVKVADPAVVGTPLSSPVAGSRLKPAGVEPWVTDQV